MSKLQTGRFIFDPNNKKLSDRLTYAAEIYKDRTNRYPNLAHVHPDRVDDIDFDFDGHAIIVESDARLGRDITYIGMGVFD